MCKKPTLMICALVLLGVGIVPTWAGLQDGLVSYFKLDESSGTVAADASGNANNGTLIGTLLSWVPGYDGGALGFAIPATGDFPDRLEFPTRGMSVTAGTVCVWAYMTDPQPASQGRYFFGHDSASGTSFADRIQLYMQDGTNVSTKLDFGLGGSHTVATDIRDLPMKEWFHLVMTWNNGIYFIYFNGAQIATGTYSGLTTLSSVANFGNDGCGAPYEPFCGMLDEARVYNRALAAAEVKAIFRMPPSSKTMAQAPSPADEASDVLCDAGGELDGQRIGRYARRVPRKDLRGRERRRPDQPQGRPGKSRSDGRHV
ncbi:MAG: LamG domain-containing protein [Phycisphaerae bacterium]|nr:LamG domain-containing protein [Phycisphaerae bacterium]